MHRKTNEKHREKSTAMMRPTTPLKRRRPGQSHSVAADPSGISTYVFPPHGHLAPIFSTEASTDDKYFAIPSNHSERRRKATTQQPQSRAKPVRSHKNIHQKDLETMKLYKQKSDDDWAAFEQEFPTREKEKQTVATPSTHENTRSIGSTASRTEIQTLHDSDDGWDAFEAGFPPLPPQETTLVMSRLADWETLNDDDSRCLVESRQDDQANTSRRTTKFQHSRSSDMERSFERLSISKPIKKKLIIALEDSNQLSFTGTVSEGSTLEKGWGVFSHFVKRKKYEKRAAVYEGAYQCGMFHGKGIYRDVDGYTYQGEFQHSQRHGSGKATWALDSSKVKTYDGEWKFDEMDGQGRLDDGNFVYTGGFCCGLRNGRGTATYSNGDLYTGSWKQGKRHGHGELLNYRGKVIQRGRWAFGNFVG